MLSSGVRSEWRDEDLLEPRRTPEPRQVVEERGDVSAIAGSAVKRLGSS
jgi:hypothetical protein